MFGVQWDLVLKYIETKKSSTIEDIQNKLNSNSTPIGNYYDSSFTLNRGKFAQYGALSSWYDFNSENKKSLVKGGIKQQNHRILLTTGASEEFSKQGIYDLAGNVWEWTLEYTSSSDFPCAIRGGNSNFSGSNYPAVCRGDDDTISYNSLIGFRVSLF